MQTSKLLRDYVGGTPKEAANAFHSASPIDFVTSQSVPTLLFHGPRDPLVWFLQSERLYKKLTDNKVPTVFIRLPWATHGFDYNFDGPGGQVSTYAIDRFLRKVMPQ